MYLATGRNEGKEVGRGLSGGRRSWQVTETEESMAHLGKEQLFRMIWIEDKFEKWWEIRLRGQSRGMIHRGVRMISAGGTKEFQKLYAGEWYYPISILEISVRLLCGGTKAETGDQEGSPFNRLGRIEIVSSFPKQLMQLTQSKLQGISRISGISHILSFILLN